MRQCRLARREVFLQKRHQSEPKPLQLSKLQIFFVQIRLNQNLWDGNSQKYVQNHKDKSDFNESKTEIVFLL